VSKLHLFRDSNAAVEASDPAPDRLVSGMPKAETINVFESDDGKLFSGIWRATIGAWRVSYDETEYCHITKGRARLIDQAGAIKDVQSGDGFVIEAGFAGIWEVLEDMEKHYMIVLP
jgi:uncharacterized protein